MPEPVGHLPLHTQLTAVIAALESELADLELQREQLAAEIDKVLYRHTPTGERRTGQQRRTGRDRRRTSARTSHSTRRGQAADRRLSQQQRLAKLDAQITALLETTEILRSRHQYLLATSDGADAPRP